MNEKMNEILRLEGVSYTYSAGTSQHTDALDHVSAGFEKGKITGVIGHTGSGKSTLAQLLNGLLRPDSGKVLFHGRDIWEKPKEIAALRFRVGLVMQYPEYQLFDETVERDIGFGLRNMKLPADEINTRVREAAAFVGLTEEHLKKSPFDLSGGEKRRAAVAGIIAMRPEVLVLDEPAAGLDPRGRRQILSGLYRYGRESGTTVILVSHSMEDMALYCDNILVMDHARVLLYGTTGEVFSRTSDLLGAGLDIPEISRISAELLAAGVPLTGALYTVDGVERSLLSLLGKGGAAC